MWSKNECNGSSDLSFEAQDMLRCLVRPLVVFKAGSGVK
jgi:hypothetical protein